MANRRTAHSTETSSATEENGPADQTQPICFVIQPFDRGKFDKRYKDAFEPGLAKAGFEAYRVDQDPGTDVVIAAIEEGIRRAAICLADVTTNNPNVWYELGYACPSSNKWDRCLVLLRECFAHHFHVTRRVVDSANDVSR